MLEHAQLAVFGAGHAPDTLLGSCGHNSGLACRLVWNVSHNGRAATLTSEFLAGPVHLLLRVIFVVLIALLVQALAHRLINRLTERAARSQLPQLRNGRSARHGQATGTRRLVPRRPSMRHTPGWRLGQDDGSADGSADRSADGRAVKNGVAQSEAALVDERHRQRVRALGAILRSAASVTIFVIAGFAVLGDLGINLAPLLASSAVVGMSVGFGAQSMVRDYLSGVFMLVEDQYGVGD
ncbi:MAG: mechanosensitive ion channel family protein, partial [Trebonia sp.]